MRQSVINLQQIIYLLIATIIILFNWYSTPTMLDDLAYRFVWQPEWDQPLERINSLDDVVRSQSIHYWCNNGRYLVHTTAQILLNLVPVELVKILNSAMFLFMIWVITKYVTSSCENRHVIISLTFSMIFLLIVGVYPGFFWLIGSFNYLWPIVINMVFILLLEKIAKTKRKWHYLMILVLPLSVIAGWTHEGLSVPVSVALLYWLWRHRTGLSRNPVTYCVIAYMAGIMMIMLSPALWNRAYADGMSLQQRIVYGLLNMVTNIRISWLLIITIGIQIYRNKTEANNRLQSVRYILIAWIVALGIVVACGCTVSQVGVFADFIAMLALLRIWQGSWLCKHKIAITSVCMLTTLGGAIPAIALNRENHDNYLYHCKQLETPNCHLIKTRQVTDSKNVAVKWLTKRYVNPNVQYGFYCCYMAFDKHDFNSKAVGFLFNKKDIVMLPEDIVDHIECDSTAYSHWEADKNEKLYVWKLKPHQRVDRVVFELGDEVSLKFYQQPLSYDGYEYELNSFNYEVININDCDYLIMTIPTTNIKRRIKNIRIEPAA